MRKKIFFTALLLGVSLADVRDCSGQFAGRSGRYYAPVLSAGGYHTVARMSDGTVAAVGRDTHNQCAVAAWSNIVQVAAGSYHTIAVLSDGSMLAVGNNTYGQCNLGAWQNIVHAHAGLDHTVGVKADGTAVAVGNNDYGRCNVGSWTTIIQASAGNYHTLGLQADGTVVAAGANFYGESSVGNWSNIVQVSAGGGHSVGLRADGTVVAAGHNANAQCNVSSWSNIIQVAAGGNHTVGLQADGAVVAVGLGTQGQTGVGGWSNITQIAAGIGHTVGLRSDGAVVAVGLNGDGQCNVSSWKTMGNPQVAGDWHHTLGLKADGRLLGTGKEGWNKISGAVAWSDIKQMAAGYQHSAGVKSDGSVQAVGRTNEGQCNAGAWLDMIQADAGFSHTVALRSDGAVFAVGSNGDGQCNVGGWSNITQIAAGTYHSVGLQADGTVVAIGNNGSARCEVGAWSNIIQVAADDSHTVGLTATGTVVVVGNTGSGQGNVGTWSNIVQVAAGRLHTVGLQADGRVVAASSSPMYDSTDVGSWSNIIQIAAGAHYTLGLKADGTVLATGRNDDGQCNVGAWFLGRLTHTLIYTAGANGGIIGLSPQIVEHGDDGAQVEAMPDAGYRFINWSDDSTANPRIDVNVTNDISVTAAFALNPPAAPAGVSASSGTYTDKVRVTWHAVSNASGYIVYRHESDSSSLASNVANVSSAFYNDMTAAVGIAYYYWVKATNAAGAGAFSASDSGWRGAAAVITGNPQSITKNAGDAASFSVDAIGTAPLYYQWQKNGSNIPAATSTTYRIAAVAPGDAGQYRCMVSNMLGFAVSASASLVVLEYPAAPTGVSASAGTYADKVRVIWNEVAGAASYQVWRHTTKDSSRAVLAGNVEAVAASPVAAVADRGSSLDSSVAAVADRGSVAVSDEIGAAGIAQFQVSSLSYDDEAVAGNTTYYYWVKAVSAAGPSGFSAAAAGYPGVLGPLVSINGMIGENARAGKEDKFTIAVEMMNLPAAYIDREVDWWLVAYAHDYDIWYFLDNDNGAMSLRIFDGLPENCRPAYGGPLANLPRRNILENFRLSPGDYTVWFIVDYPMDGILEFIPGRYLMSSVKLVVAP